MENNNYFDFINDDELFKSFGVSNEEDPFELTIPMRSTKNSAGYDFFAPKNITIPSGETVIIKTGIKVHLDSDKVLMIVPRSSMGIKHGITLANTIGIIDSDYYSNPDNDGHIMIALFNNSPRDYEIKMRDKIAQGIITNFYVTKDDNCTEERTGGIGSTGK